tara:strand:- start:21 stop:239 length:219 start_codon:yes stop_codon:yes gene_type:complete
VGAKRVQQSGIPTQHEWRVVSQMNLDDIKVGIASVTGLGNWMVNIDLVLKIGISVASLIYITLKIRELLSDD